MVFSDLHNSFMQIPLPFLMFWTNTASLDGDFDYVSSFTASQASCAQEKNHHNFGSDQMDLLLF